MIHGESNGFLGLAPFFGGKPEEQIQVIPDSRPGTVSQYLLFCSLVTAFVDDRQDSVIGAFEAKKQHDESRLVDIFKQFGGLDRPGFEFQHPQGPHIHILRQDGPCHSVESVRGDGLIGKGEIFSLVPFPKIIDFFGDPGLVLLPVIGIVNETMSAERAFPPVASPAGHIRKYRIGHQIFFERQVVKIGTYQLIVG